jgi:hypothetical protein
MKYGIRVGIKEDGGKRRNKNISKGKRIYVEDVWVSPSGSTRLARVRAGGWATVRRSEPQSRHFPLKSFSISTFSTKTGLGGLSMHIR